MSIALVMPSRHLILWSPLLLPSIFPSIRDFAVSQLFASDDQNTGVSASASVLPTNIQGWFPLRLTGLISLLSKRLPVVFSSFHLWLYSRSGKKKKIQGIRSDRVPEELSLEVRDILQEAVIKTISKKKKCKKAKWLSEEALQIAGKRKVKGKGEEEKYTHLNTEFQKIVRRDKKAFLSDQCKERKENNRMGKTRDLFKKIRDTKGTVHQTWAK